MATKKVLVNKAYSNREEKQCSRCGSLFYVQPSKASRYAMCSGCRAKTYHPPVILHCAACDGEFTVKGHLRHVQQFCSVDCRWKEQRENPAAGFAKTCPGCGSAFRATHQRIIYCSVKCASAARRRDDHQCDQCGQCFHKQRKSTNKSPLRFCSPRGKGAYFSGPHHPLWVTEREHMRDDRGPGWDAIAEAIRQRDGYTCQRCGTKQSDWRALDVHHLVPYRLTQNNHPDNLTSLCLSCHKIVEEALLRSDSQQ